MLRTSGDAGATGDKSRWVDTIEAALVDGEIDLAVHSAKDVPGELAAGTEIVATPEREDARDVLIGDAGGRIGTSSLRRRAQLCAAGHADVADLRGNVDTRLRKLADGEVDAIVLAAAGLRRLGREERATPLEGELFVPAPGQGVLLVESTGETLPQITDAATWDAVQGERAFVAALEGDCDTPLGIHLTPDRGEWHARAFVGAVDGSAWLTDELAGEDPVGLGERVAERMLAAGANEVLGR